MGSYSRSLPRTVERLTASSAGWSLRACMVRHCLAAVLQVFGQRLHSDTIPLLRVLGGSEFACLERSSAAGRSVQTHAKLTCKQTTCGIRDTPQWGASHARQSQRRLSRNATRHHMHMTHRTSPVGACHMASHARRLERRLSGHVASGQCHMGRRLQGCAPHRGIAHATCGTSPSRLQGVHATSGH